jgi:hypothetical protein
LCHQSRFSDLLLATSDLTKIQTYKNFAEEFAPFLNFSSGTVTLSTADPRSSFRLQMYENVSPVKLVCLHKKCFSVSGVTAASKDRNNPIFVRCRMQLSHLTLKNIVHVNRPKRSHSKITCDYFFPNGQRHSFGKKIGSCVQ